MIDKGYYDYDYEPLPPAPIDIAKTARSESETRELVSKFGFGVKPPKKPAEMTASELQEHAMREQGNNN